MSTDQDPDLKRQLRFLTVCAAVGVAMAVYGAALDSAEQAALPWFPTAAAASAPPQEHAPAPAAPAALTGARR